MRLKKLTLQAFGPFKGKVMIDFENENINNGLLLISGDTGSGKTTIFDAICFALYGKTSGGIREPKSLRSDWASPEFDTYVNLEFYYKNKLYEVKRSPPYLRKKRSGEGLIEQPPTAEIDIGGSKVTKNNEVTKKIEQLIGLDYNQFRQVAMLSQGDFTKFLLADSKEKTPIFRKIFGTKFYEDLQDELNEKRKQKKEENDRINDFIDAEKKDLEPIIDVFGLNNDEIIEALNKKIKEDDETVSKTKDVRDGKNEEKIKISNELENLKGLNEKIRKYQEANKGLEELLSSNSNIDEKREKYEYNINIANPITIVLEKRDKDCESLKRKKERCAKNKKCLEIKEKEWEENEEKFKNLDNFQNDVEDLEHEIQELSNKNKDYKDYLDKLEEMDEIKKECEKNRESYAKQNSLYETMRTEYYLNVSVEIAETLEDGKECPVCGSKEHPKKAFPIHCEYTKEDVENAEKNLKEIDNIRKTNEAHIEQINKIINEYGIEGNIDVESEIKNIEEVLKTRENDKIKLYNEYNELSKKRNNLNSEIKSCKDTIKIFADEIEGLEKNIHDYDSQLNKLYEENNTNYEDYVDKKLDQDVLSSLKEKIEDFDKKKTEFDSIIRHLEEEVKGKEIVDVSDKEDQLNSLNEEFKKLDEKFTELKISLEKLNSSTEKIVEYLDELEKIQEEYEVIKVLSDTANGSLKGAQKITFENYVQAYSMQKVLVEANKRFDKMTDSRYQLKRKETDIKSRGKTGLDFSIFDSHNGKERDVTSLSGGEKFMASLALALGLSDVISNYRGGIRIDSLFIDEGFGSLDSDSLNEALNILYDLSGRDKLIGVISHVSELKGRIDNKILIKKTNEGSELSIESNI